MPYTPFAPRTISFHGVYDLDGYRLKRYSVSHDGSPVPMDEFGAGVTLAAADMPAPAVAPGRPGVGIVIAHRGPAADYAVVCWWELENELVTRVAVKTAAEGGWRPAARESFCVWDLEILWAARNAYIASVLGDTPDLEAYLAFECGRRIDFEA